MSKNRSPSAGSGSASRPRFGVSAPAASRSGSSSSYRMIPVVLAGHLQPGLLPGAPQDVRAHPVQPWQVGPPGEPAPSRDPGALQRPPLPRRDPGHQRKVVVGSPALAAHIAPPADGAVLHRLRVDLGRRIPADGGLQQPPRLPLIGGKVVHLERSELPVAERQVHPPRRDPLHVGEKLRVEHGLQHGAGLRRPRQLGVHDLVVDPGRPRLPVRRGQQVRPHQEIGPPEQRYPVAFSGQCPLIDDPSPAPDGFRRRSRAVLGPADVRDVKPLGAEPLQHGPLVHLPAPDQVLEPDVELAGRP